MTEIPNLGLAIATPYGRLGKILRTTGNVLSNIGQSNLSGVDSQYSEIIKQQMEMQRQMLLVSMHSNLERTKHEIQMAPVRNIRAG